MDELLLDRVRRGDQDALAALYHRHIRRLYSRAARIAPRDAEEVVQDVFVRVWTLAASYDATRGSVAAWLLVMTRSRALDRVRALRARPDTDGAAAATALETVPGGDDSVEHRLIGAEQAEGVRAALAALSAPQREAIELAFYGGLTHTELAAHLREPLGTVKTRVRAALMKLRDALQERA
jgi:RNA polymerase sigma-70 factor (ECF subfamily)